MRKETQSTLANYAFLLRFCTEILKLVMSGRMGLAIEHTLRSYPGLLENNQNLWFMLKCRQFVEMVNGSDFEVGIDANDAHSRVCE